jgi:hypothetical protein
MSDNRDESVDETVDEGVDVETPSVNRHVCELCGKEFDSLQGLRMHKVRVHHSGQGVGGSLATMEAPIPDAMESLRNLLQLFIGPKDSLGLIEYLKPYGPDNLFKLYEGLSNLGVALNKRKMIVEAWSVSRGLNIPENLRRELGIQPMPSFGPSMPSPYGPSYGFMEQPQQKKEDFTIFQALVEWEKLKQTQQQQPQITQTNPLESQYQMQIQTLQEQIKDLKESHTKEVDLLREELRRKDQERLENQIKALEQQIRTIESSSRPSGDYKDDSIRLLAEAVREVGRKEPLDKIKELLPQILSAAYGIPQEKLQQQIPQARLGLLEVLRQKGLTTPQ